MHGSSYLLNGIAVRERLVQREANHVPSAAGGDIPITGNLPRVLLVKHWVEYRLFWQPGRKCAVAGGGDQGQFLGAHRTVKHGQFQIHNASTSSILKQ